MNPELSVAIKEYQNFQSIEKHEWRKALIEWSLTDNNLSRKGNIYTDQTSRGDIITLDAGKRPPARTLNLAESNYKMDTKVQVAEFYPATLKYERALSAIAPRHENMQKVIDNFDYVQDLQERWKTVWWN